MLPHTSSVSHTMTFLHFLLARKHCQVLIITSISTFSSFPPLSDAFFQPPHCKTTRFFFSALSVLHHVTSLAPTASSELTGLQNSKAQFQANNHQLLIAFAY